MRAMVEGSSRGSIRWAVGVQCLAQFLARKRRREEVVDLVRDLLGEMGPPDRGPWGEIWAANQQRLIMALEDTGQVELALQKSEQFADEAHRWLEENRDAPSSREWWCLIACLSALKNRVRLLDLCGHQDEIEFVLRAARQVPGMATAMDVDPEEPPPGLPQWPCLRSNLMGGAILLKVAVLVTRGDQLMEHPPSIRALEMEQLEREVEEIERKADAGWGNLHYAAEWKRVAHCKLSSVLRDRGFPEKEPSWGDCWEYSMGASLSLVALKTKVSKHRFPLLHRGLPSKTPCASFRQGQALSGQVSPGGGTKGDDWPAAPGVPELC